MKKILFTIFGLIMCITTSKAHYLWIETNTIGTLNQEQEVRVYFGEYTYGIIEDVQSEAFNNVQEFSLWISDPLGNKTELKTSAEKKYYKAIFKPNMEGTYTVFLDNNRIKVMDYTQYDFGIFKTHYHAVAKVQVGNQLSNTIAFNKDGLSIKNLSTNQQEVILQVLYKNAVLPKSEVTIAIDDLWTKKLTTNEEGILSFNLPWPTKYIVEATYKEEVPGIYNNEKYQFIWHCATYTIPSK